MQEQKWIDEIGLTLIKRPLIDEVKTALEIEEPFDYSDDDARIAFDRAMMVLSNYYLFLQAELGAINGRISYLVDCIRDNLEIDSEVLANEKAKGQKLRPILDGLRTKIDTMRKIYDMQIRKMYDSRNIRG